MESFLKNRHRFFRLSHKWYIKQMQLFKLSGKLDARIRHTKSDIEEFTEMVDEFRTKNVAKNTDYSWKIISILYI